MKKKRKPKLYGVVIESRQCAKHGAYASTTLLFGNETSTSGCPQCRPAKSSKPRQSRVSVA